MEIYAAELPPSSARAQCYIIAGYSLDTGETIAQRIARDHFGRSNAMRAMQLMVDAGCAKMVNAKPGCYGTFIFEDGSEFK